MQSTKGEKQSTGGQHGSSGTGLCTEPEGAEEQTEEETRNQVFTF